VNRRSFLSTGLVLTGLAGLSALPVAAFSSLGQGTKRKDKSFKGVTKLSKTDAEWQSILTPQQYYVMRKKGTEAPYSSTLNENHEQGVFSCAGCGLPLFSSQAKFDSGTGWPSFYQPIARENVIEEVDNSLSATRTEVLCARCDAHLGHVFEDGPKPTGLRYCMNGVALKFAKK
jgi:peptide-methionine (R)-S-oxide reductase